MKFENIVNKLKELGVAPGQLRSILEWDDREIKKETLEKELGSILLVHQVGDCEGGGEYAENVFKFVNHDVYLREVGFYTSYHGTDWDEEFEEVKAQIKQVTIYE